MNLDRRNFLQAAAAAPILCTIGGKTIEVADVRDVELADKAAAETARPAGARQRIGGAAQAETPAAIPSQFPTPQPAPGGQVREYWVQARSVTWDIAPKKRDEWMKHRISGRTKFRAFVYQLMSTGFAEPLGRASMPGPTLEAEVGDLLVVHFRNADTRFNQAITMHPHGVKYNPEYDGSYLGDHTRARRLHRARARSSPTAGSARRTPSASGRTTTTVRTTRSTRCAACTARSSCGKRARSGPTSRPC